MWFCLHGRMETISVSACLQRNKLKMIDNYSIWLFQVKQLGCGDSGRTWALGLIQSTFLRWSLGKVLEVYTENHVTTCFFYRWSQKSEPPVIAFLLLTYLQLLLWDLMWENIICDPMLFSTVGFSFIGLSFLLFHFLFTCPNKHFVRCFNPCIEDFKL